MKKQKKYWNEYIEKNIIKCDISYRGGVLKVNVSDLFPSLAESGDEAVMGASQNYLGGGIAGAISGGQMFDKNILSKEERVVFEELSEAIKKFFYEVNNGGGDEYMQEEGNGGYEENQARAVSAY